MRPWLAASLSLVYFTLLFCIGLVNSTAPMSIAFPAVGIPLVVLALFFGESVMWRLTQLTLLLVIADHAAVYLTSDMRSAQLRTTLMAAVPGILLLAMIQAALPAKRRKSTT